MRFDHEEFSKRLGAINEASGIMALRRAVMDALQLCGITAAYFRTPLGADPRMGSQLYNSDLPDVWERHYRSALYQFDPLPQIALAQLRPLVWPDAVDMDQLDPRQRRYLRIAARHGVGRGIGIVCFGPNGRCGFMGAILPGDGPAPNQTDLMRVHTVAQLSFLRHCFLVRPGEGLPQLSNRELEVLQWMAQGKSNPIIASILGISPSSVDIYVKRIFAKLGVTDRTSAAVRAVSLGLWIPSDQRRAEPPAAEGAGKDQGR